MVATQRLAWTRRTRSTRRADASYAGAGVQHTPHASITRSIHTYPFSHHITSHHITSPHLTSPHLTSPHLTSPHLIFSPRMLYHHLISTLCYPFQSLLLTFIFQMIQSVSTSLSQGLSFVSRLLPSSFLLSSFLFNIFFC